MRARSRASRTDVHHTLASAARRLVAATARLRLQGLQQLDYPQECCSLKSSHHRHRGRGTSHSSTNCTQSAVLMSRPSLNVGGGRNTRARASHCRTILFSTTITKSSLGTFPVARCPPAKLWPPALRLRATDLFTPLPSSHAGNLSSSVLPGSFCAWGGGWCVVWRDSETSRPRRGATEAHQVQC